LALEKEKLIKEKLEMIKSLTEERANEESNAL